MKQPLSPPDWPLRLAAVATLVLAATGVMVWQGKEDNPLAKAPPTQNPASVQRIEQGPARDTAAMLRPPALVSPAAATPQQTDPFTAFLEAAKASPGLLPANQVPAPDREQMSPAAFKAGLEAGKPPEPLPTTSPFGSPH
jgi:hypothetical protein